jgi:glycoside/pentoside/hexuronide:cation symporter, GPH family
MAEQSLRPRTVAAYATAVAPMAILSLPFSVYLPPFIAEGGILSIATIGLIFSISAAWDGIVDPIIGSIIDKKHNGDAPHQRWMIRAALPLALLLILLVVFGEQSSAFILLPILLLFYSAYSLFDVAHLSWGSALADNPEASSRLFGAREFSGKIAVVIAFGAPALLQAFVPDISIEGRILAYTSIALLAIPLAILAIRNIPPRPIIAQPGIGWRAELAASLGSRPLLLLAGVQLFNAFAFGSLTALFVFFVDAYLQLDRLSSIILFLTFIGGAFAAPVWTAIAKRTAKPTLMIAMPIWLIMVLASGWFLPINSPPHTMLFGLCLGFGFVGLIFIYGMVSDLAPIDAKMMQRDRTAFLYAIINVIQKIGVSLAIATSYALLGWGGFDTETKTGSGEIVRALFLLLPSISWLVMMILLLFLRREPLFQISTQLQEVKP